MVLAQWIRTLIQPYHALRTVAFILGRLEVQIVPTKVIGGSLLAHFGRK